MGVVLPVILSELLAPPDQSMSAFFGKLLASERSFQTQAIILVVQAIFWATVIPVIRENIIKPFVSKQPWKKHWTALQLRTGEKHLGIKLTNAEAFHFGCDFIAISAQHAVGGALCLPAALGFQTPLTVAMAMHGASCEGGWELQDLVTRLYKLAIQEESFDLFIFFGIHHVMGVGMTIPMNMYYGSDPCYHEFVCMLQFAAFIAIASLNYGYTLDIRTKDGLKKKKASVVVTWVVMAYSRCLRYIVVTAALMKTSYEDGRFGLFWFGVLAHSCMLIINFIFLSVSTKHLIKYMSMVHKPKTNTH
jgi:hypothetical protein